MAGSGPAAEGSWAGPGPGAETAGEPGAAAAQNDNQERLRHSRRDGTHKIIMFHAQTYYTLQCSARPEAQNHRRDGQKIIYICSSQNLF